MVSDNLHYWKKDATTSVLINEGILDWTGAANAVTEDKQYIGEQNAITKMKAYKPTITYSGEVIDDDEFALHLYEIGKDEKLGETITEIEVETWKSAEGTKYPAYQHVYEVQPGNAGSGAGGSALLIAGVLAQIGSVVKGTFDIESKTFTAK